MYRFFRRLAWLIGLIAAPWRVTGKENIPPKEGRGLMVVANHIYWWDPILLAIIMPYPVHFMAKEELFKNKLSAWFLKGVGAFPVRRNSADIGAIKKSLTLLKGGEALCIFPEGTRGEGFTEFHKGAATVALKADALVLPMYIAPYRMFRHVCVSVGAPLLIRRQVADLPKEEQASAATERIERKIKNLRENCEK